VKEIPPVSAEKPYQYQYAQHTASDLFMLSEIMKAIAHKYDEDVVQQAFKKCGEGEGTDFPLHYLWKAAEQLATDEYRHQHVVRAHQAKVRAGQVLGRYGRRLEKPCPLKTLLRLADTSEPFLRAVMHEIIRGIEREVPHAFALFRHLMGLEVGVSPATLSRAKAEALPWLQARADHNLHPRKRQSIPPACPALHHRHGNTWHQDPSIYLAARPAGA
jgi:hypothetical protein